MFLHKTKAHSFILYLMYWIGIWPIHAELPTMNDKKWIGYFIGSENKDFRFQIDSKGKTRILVFSEKETLLKKSLSVSIEFHIDEIMPDGKFTPRSIIVKSLESDQMATFKPKDIVISGKVIGDATFQIFITENNGSISLGGRILEAGTLIKNPLRFSIKVKFPSAYSPNKAVAEKDKLEQFKKAISQDRLQLILNDGKMIRRNTSHVVDASSKEISGSGISSAKLEYHAYEGKKFWLVASPNSLMMLTSIPNKPLYAGLVFTWTANLAQDPEEKSRLTIDIK